MDTNTRTPCADPPGEPPNDPGLLERAYRDRARFGRPGPKSWLDQLRQGRRRAQRIPALPDALFYLQVPMRLDSDAPWQPGPGPDHPFGVGEYDRQGRVIPREPLEQWARLFTEAHRQPRIARTTLFRQGARLTVSTVFLGTDLGGMREPDQPPVLWETMIFAGRTTGEPLRAWRYASQPAAQYGHAAIVYALGRLRAAGRSVRVRPARAGARPWRGSRRRGWRR